MSADGKRDHLVRRNLILLVAAQAAVFATNGTFFTIGVVAMVDLSGRERWAGILLALFNLSAAASALLAGRLMDRVGRRPGLLVGHALFAVAAIGCALAVRAESPWALLAMTIPFGAGLGAANLGRVAAADMVSAERRGRVVGWIVAAGTIGALGAPPLAAAIEHLTDSSVAPWLLIPAFEVVGIAAVLALRPDPRELAVVEQDVVSDDAPRRTLGQLLAVPPLRAAVVAIVVAQTAMVAVMGVTPVALDHHGSSSLVIAIVISVHMAGMFAVAPAVGYLLDAYGRRAGLLVGGVLSAAGALVGSISFSPPLVGVGMFLVGLGWAACYLGATAAISDLTRPSERGGTLGFADLATSLTSAGGALAAGFVLETGGIAVVGITMAAIMLPVLLLVLPLREPSPGRWTLTARPQTSP